MQDTEGMIGMTTQSFTKATAAAVAGVASPTKATNLFTALH